MIITDIRIHAYSAAYKNPIRNGKYTYPADKDKIYYHHRRGFEDCFEAPQNIPFRSCL